MILACVDSNVLAGNRVSHAFIISRHIAVLLCHYLSVGTACLPFSDIVEIFFQSPNFSTSLGSISNIAHTFPKVAKLTIGAGDK